MTWGTVAVAGATLVSGMMSADAAGDASAAQVAASDRATAERRRQFDVVQGLLKPYVDAGGPALQAYRDLIGLGGTPATVAPGTAGAAETEAQIRARLSPQFTTTAPDRFTFSGDNDTPIAIPGFQTVDTTGLNAAVQAEIARQQQTAGPASGGVSAQTAQQQAIDALKASPQFSSLSSAGEEAILQNAAATGGLRGGNTQNSLARFRSDLLSSLIDKQLARYAGVAQMGQNSAAGVGTAALTTGQGIAGDITQAGAAQAGGIMAGSNAITGAVGNIGGIVGARLAGGGAPTLAGGTSSFIPSESLAGGFGTGVVNGYSMPSPLF